MKKIIMITVAVLAGVGLSTVSYTHAATITGSKHDLSASTGGEICIACHTPHNANTTITDAPLWNHTMTTATYTLYDSPTFNGHVSISQPTGVSKLCLSCHDGTVAPDAFTGHAGVTTIATAGNLGTNLKKSHPISFTYDAALATADGELKDPGTLPAGWINNSKFECSSCHDVHNKTGIAKMLHATNTGSALCLTCHLK